MELAAAVESARLAVVRAIVVTMAGQVLALKLKLLMIFNLYRPFCFVLCLVLSEGSDAVAL